MRDWMLLMGLVEVGTDWVGFRCSLSTEAPDSEFSAYCISSVSFSSDNYSYSDLLMRMRSAYSW